MISDPLRFTCYPPQAPSCTAGLMQTLLTFIFVSMSMLMLNPQQTQEPKCPFVPPPRFRVGKSDQAADRPRASITGGQVLFFCFLFLAAQRRAFQT